MIFDTNTTSLNSTIDFPVLENYDCAYGHALALLDNARNDYAIFEAMLKVDANEIAIRRSSSSYFAEAELVSLQEASIKNIFESIATFFKNLGSKIKTIFLNFVEKIKARFLTTKKIINTYKGKLGNKDLSGLEFKYRKPTSKDVFLKGYNTFGNNIPTVQSVFDMFGGQYNQYTDEEIWANTFSHIKSQSDYEESLEKKYWADTEAKKVKINQTLFSGPDEIINTLSMYCDKGIGEIKKGLKNATKKCADEVKNFEKASKEATDEYVKKQYDNGDDDARTSPMREAKLKFEIAKVVQAGLLTHSKVLMSGIKTDYAQLSAMIRKIIASSKVNSSTNESYLNTLEEVVTNEVEDVIDTAINDDPSDITDINNASTTVLDDGVSDDLLTYDGDQDYDSVATAGMVDTNINSKSESAFFGALLY